MVNKRKIVVSGYYGFDNFGDEAILSVLTDELNKNNFDITVFSKQPTKTAKNRNVNAVYTFDIKNVIQTIKNSDVLISGGGSLLQDATSLKSLLYYLFVISCAIILKKDVLIYAQGIGPIKNFLGRNITKTLLKKCKYISIRDEKSKKLLDSWKINSELLSDPVWNIKVNETFPKNRIGIQLRSWKSLSNEFLDKLVEQINKHYSNKEICIYSFQDNLDLDVCKSFEYKLKQINPDIKTTILNNQTIDETIESFSNLDYLIAMRYHACLLGLKYRIPVLAINYDIKVEKIAHRFKLPCASLTDKESLSPLFEQLKNYDIEHINKEINHCLYRFENLINACK